MQQLLIRLDDIAPAMNWEHFERLEALFAQYHIRPIIGVVPDCQDPKLSVQDAREDFWEKLRALQDKGWTIAQHGFSHEYVTDKSGILGVKNASEFAGVPFREQYRKLKRGQEILHKNGICATMFMAPGHTYDRNTLRALKKLGFTSVTDGYCSKPYRRMGLVFLPCTLSEPRAPKAFDTVCIHANHMSQDDFVKLEEFVKKYPKMFADAGMYVNADCPIRNEEHGGADLRAGQSFRIAPYHPGMWLSERINLLKFRIKRFAANNYAVQEYFQRTDDAKPAVKKGKRILGLPGLMLRLLFCRGGRA